MVTLSQEEYNFKKDRLNFFFHKAQEAEERQKVDLWIRYMEIVEELEKEIYNPDLIVV